MTTFYNKANAHKANDSKEEAVICKKNRLYDLPSELENYIYSFVEDSLHNASHKKLFIDNTFIKLMWKKYYWTSSDFFYNYFRDGVLQKRYNPIMITNKKYLELDSDFLIEKIFKEKNILPSDIHIDYKTYYPSHIAVNGKKYKIYNPSMAFEAVCEYFKDDDNFFKIKASTFCNFLKIEPKDYRPIKKEIEKLIEEKNRRELMGLIKFPNIIRNILYSTEPEIKKEIFGKIVGCFRTDGFLVEE